MQNITDDELIVVDLILKRLPYGEAVNYTGFINNLLTADQYQELGEEKYNKAVQVLQTMRDRHFISYMREQKYIEIVNQSIPSYTLTDRGKEARDKGGHVEFIKWQEEQAAIAAAKEEQDKREQKKMAWPQKNWLLVMLIGAVIGAIVAVLFTEGVNWFKSPFAEKDIQHSASDNPPIKDTITTNKNSVLPAKNIK